MGRKRTLNRMEMRTDFEETEEVETADDDEEGDDDDEEGDDEAESDGEEDAEPIEAEESGDDEEEVKPKKKKKAAAKPKAPAKPRSRTAKHVPMKIVWGVFNNSNNQVESFPYNQEADARAHAEKLTTDKKQTHFVQKVKKPLVEKEKVEKV